MSIRVVGIGNRFEFVAKWRRAFKSKAIRALGFWFFLFECTFDGSGPVVYEWARACFCVRLDAFCMGKQ